MKKNELGKGVECDLLPEIFRDYIEVQFILQGKINKDALENLFSRVRSSLGNNVHPSINEMRYLMAKIMSSDILSAAKNTNCEDDGCVPLPFEVTKVTGGLSVQKYLELNESDTEEGESEDETNDLRYKGTFRATQHTCALFEKPNVVDA